MVAIMALRAQNEQPQQKVIPVEEPLGTNDLRPAIIIRKTFAQNGITIGRRLLPAQPAVYSGNSRRQISIKQHGLANALRQVAQHRQNIGFRLKHVALGNSFALAAVQAPGNGADQPTGIFMKFVAHGHNPNTSQFLTGTVFIKMLTFPLTHCRPSDESGQAEETLGEHHEICVTRISRRRFSHRVVGRRSHVLCQKLRITEIEAVTL
jgi:hypothetical protein